MSNFEGGPRNPNVDPGLYKNEQASSSNDNSADNQWTKLANESPSYHEHMQQMQQEAEQEQEDGMSM